MYSRERGNIEQDIMRLESVLYALEEQIEKLAHYSDFAFLREPSAPYPSMQAAKDEDITAITATPALNYVFHSSSALPKVKNIHQGHFSCSEVFNMKSAQRMLRNVFWRDLPKRIGMEKWMAHYRRKVHALRKRALYLQFVDA